MRCNVGRHVSPGRHGSALIHQTSSRNIILVSVAIVAIHAMRRELLPMALVIPYVGRGLPAILTLTMTLTPLMTMRMRVDCRTRIVCTCRSRSHCHIWILARDVCSSSNTRSSQNTRARAVGCRTAFPRLLSPETGRDCDGNESMQMSCHCT